MNGEYVVGMDGGGTKTTVAVKMLNSETIKKQFGAFNINGQSAVNTKETLHSICQWLCTMPNGLDGCKGMCIGAAGIVNPVMGETIINILQSCGYKGAPKLVGDHETALYSAFEGEEGVLVIAGTGSICCGLNAAGDMARTGGWGQLIDDEGSGYAIARDILRAMMRAEDGRIESTALKELVLNHLELQTPTEVLAWLYTAGRTKKEIASLARLLEVAMRKKDKAAEKIADKAASELAILVKATTQKLGLQSGKFAMAGSILQKDKFVQSAMIYHCEKTLPQFTGFVLKAKAEDGAVLLALKLRE